MDEAPYPIKREVGVAKFEGWIASEQSSSQRREGDGSHSRLREPPKGAWRSSF